MGTAEAIGLAVLQGLTEFLPVSSSGHLALAHWLVGSGHGEAEALPLEYVVLVHFGTLLAVIVYYWRDLGKILRDVFAPGAQAEGRRPRGWGRKLGALLIVATVPAGMVGYAAADYVEGLFNIPWLVGIALLVTGTALLISERVGSREKGDNSTTWLDAWLVGCAQSVALIPGISRSGVTIAAGLAVGFRRGWAPRFAFLMSVPVILGGSAFELRELIAQGGSGDLALYSLCGLISAMTGYVAIRMVIGVVQAGNLKYFAAYCYLVGALAIVASGFDLL